MTGQLSIFDLSSGEKGRDAAIEQLIQKNKTFVEVMREIARMLAKRKTLISTDDLREIASEYGITPETSNKSYGAIFNKEFEAVGFIKSKIPTSHARPIRTWRLIESLRNVA